MRRVIATRTRISTNCIRAPIAAVRSLSSAATDVLVKKTALYDAHVDLGGKPVPFAGYLLPIKYKEGDIDAHKWVRNNAGVFDVSHMGQLRIRGAKRVQFLESLVPGDLQALKEDQLRLSVLTNERGGILDDCVIANKKDHIFMVVNAGCKDDDIKHMRAHLAPFNAKHGADVTLEYVQDRSLLALQGPKAAEVLGRHVGDVQLSSLPFMFTREMKVDGIDCWVTRCGYTGEDGFEISVPNTAAVSTLYSLLKNSEVKPSGLGPRDSLRLEAGLCLYGHDLNTDITPIEAGLAWLIGKRRREQGGFLGYDIIKNQIANGVAKKRVGFAIKSGPPARDGAPIKDSNGAVIGTITSGTFSPSLGRAIAMGYINTPFAKEGTAVSVEVRGKLGAAEVAKMPFVATRYFK